MPLIKTEGTYEVTITDADFGRRDNDKRTPYLYLKGETQEGNFIGAYLWLSEKAFEKTDRDLKEVFKFDGNYRSAVGQIKGKPCQFVVEMEEDQNDPTKAWPRVRWVNKPGGGSVDHIKIENQTDFLDNLTKMSGGAVPETTPENSQPPSFL